MAATIRPHRPHLQLATATRAEVVPQVSRRPALRPIDGGRSQASLRRRRVFWRRRLMVALGLLTALLAVWQLAIGVTAMLADPAPDVVPAATTPPAPVAASTYVVRSGDTLWSIASRVAPGRDPRPIVDELSHRLGGAPVRPGQRLDVQGLAA